MHFGIAHEEDERFVRPPVDNILSQSVADVKPLRTGRTGTRGAGIVGEVAALPSAQPRGMLARIGELPERPREGDFIPRTVIQDLGLQPREEGQPPSVFRPETRVEAAAGAEVFTPSKGISTTPTAPVLGKIDFSSIEGLLKGIGTVTDFTRNLQKFNRARGITPGGKRRKVKISDIQKMIEFQQGRIDEGFVAEEELPEAMNKLDILNQFIQGVTGTRSASDIDEERIRKLAQTFNR